MARTGRDHPTHRRHHQRAGAGEDVAALDPELTWKVEAALVQVGYHGDEASAIARRLSSADGEDETTSRTELTARLKARARLGEQAEAKKKAAVDRSPRRNRKPTTTCAPCHSAPGLNSPAISRAT